jgi:hypothetical protein
MLLRQDRRWFALQWRQIVHEIIQRRQRATPRVTDHRIEPAIFRLPGEERDSQRLRIAQFRRHVRQHRQTTGDVESAHDYRPSCGTERTRQIDGTRKLVRLHADKRDQRPAARPPDIADDAVRADTPIGLVKCVQPKFDIRAEHQAPPCIFSQSVQAGECVRRNGRSNPLDRITVVVVVRWLDHHEVKDAGLVRAVCGRHAMSVSSP